MALSPKQFEEQSESTDYNTGYRSATHSIAVPDWREHPGEPSGIYAHARETSRNQWTVHVTAGPHLERDDRGSYYKPVEDFTHEGPPGSLKPVLRRHARDAWGKIIGARQA